MAEPLTTPRRVPWRERTPPQRLRLLSRRGGVCAGSTPRRAHISVRGELAWRRKCGTLLEPLAKGSKGDRCPMLCLHDSIRHDDPSVQRLLGVVEEAQTLAELMLAVWSLARVLAVHVVEEVLAQRAL